MGPSSAKMASGSELDVIFGRLRTKMEVKFDLKAILRLRMAQGGPQEAKMGPRWAQDGSQEGPRWPQDGPRSGQDGLTELKTAEDEAKEVKSRKCTKT